MPVRRKFRKRFTVSYMNGGLANISSIVIGAGNRTQDGAITKQMSTEHINRMFHVQLKADSRQWLRWVQSKGVYPWVLEYI